MTNRDQSPADALSVAFVVKGFIERIQEMGKPQFWCGSIDDMQELIDLAELSDQVFWELPEGQGCVWAYEIDEPFGHWLAHTAREDNEFPTKDRCLVWLHRQYEQAAA